MTRAANTSRRTFLAGAIAAAAAAGTAGFAVSASAAGPGTRSGSGSGGAAGSAPIDHHAWNSARDWRTGKHQGTRAAGGRRPGVELAGPAGTSEYTDPHTGRTEEWEYAVWTSPVHRLRVPATEIIASWNAHTPAATWVQIELQGTYADGKQTPWYVMGRWASADTDIRRTSVDDQSDNLSSVWTDTLAVDDPASGLRVTAYQLRLTLYRSPGSSATPTVWRAGALGSDIPDRFEVPASKPSVAKELRVPRYSQNTHIGQYPEYDNGGEAWCSPTSSQMIIEYWGRKPSKEDLAWVNPDYADPQVCHAARYTFDYQYDGCGNWPFNAAYAATYRDMQGAVTRLASLTDVERLIGAGIPVITSQSFLAKELTGAGYGTAGHLMTVIGFTSEGDVIANDPASKDNAAVRRVYKRREWENIWLRTKRYDAEGKVKSGTGGVCYVYWPLESTPGQQRVLRSLGLI